MNLTPSQTTDHSNGPSGFKRDLHELGQGVGTLGTDLSTVAHEAMAAARSGGADLRTGAEHTLQAAKGKLTDAEHAAKDAAHSLKELVVQHPMASVGIAACVGLLVGLALLRPRS